jgi:hypothetical protein
MGDRSIGGVVCTVTVLAVAGFALAQTPAAIPAGDGDALRGPAVKQAPKVSTLVKRDMSGNLERIDTRPEQAALDVLGLTADERKPADKVMSDRFAAVTKLLQQHQDLFLKIQQGRQGGVKPEELRPQMREMREAATPLLENPLEDQVATALPEAKRAEFRRLVDEYKRVVATEEPRRMRQGAGTGGGKGRGRGNDGEPNSAAPDEMKKDAPKEPGKAPAEGPIPPRVEMNLLLREMGRALNAIVVERREHMDSFLKAIDATPEQEGQIRAIVRTRPEKKDGEAAKPTGIFFGSA